MQAATSKVTIAAARDRVWEVLADIGNVANYNDGLQDSWLLGDRPQEEPCGVGTGRRCVVNDKLAIDETVTALEIGHSYTLELSGSTGFLPTSHVIVTFGLTDLPSGHTEVTQTMSYALKGGALGALLAPLMRGSIRTAVERNLAGLKGFVEVDGSPR
jgi:hypothetical protein